MLRRILSKLAKDPEYWFIILFNGGIIFLYLTNAYDYRFAVWGFYLQSVFVGLQYVSISFLKHYKAHGSFLPLKSHSLTFFFIVHFGLFHFVYFVFLMVMSARDVSVDQVVSLVDFIKSTLLFLFINTLFLSGRELVPGLPDYPKPSVIVAYLRIIPIHLFIILAGFQDSRMARAFLVFMCLKLVLDLAVYMFTSSRQKLDSTG